MKYYKIFLASLVILAILTLGCVSANSDNATDIAVTDDDAGFDAMAVDSSEDADIEQIDESQADEVQNVNQNEDTLTFNPDDLQVNLPKTIVLDGEDGNWMQLKISLPKDESGDISIYEKGKLISSFNTNAPGSDIDVNTVGNTKVFVKALSCIVGNIKYTVKFTTGSETYEKSATVDVTYVLHCFDTLYYGESQLRIVTPVDATGTVTVLIDGKKYPTYGVMLQGDHEFKGYFAKNTDKLSLGKHQITITYSGDARYPSRTVHQTFTVIPKIIMPSGWIIKSSDTVSLTLPKKAKGSLVVKVYDSKNKLVKKFTKKVSKGKAAISFSKYKFYGKYAKIVATYTGSDYKVSQETVTNVVINPPFSLTKKMLKGEKKRLSINLPGKKGVLKLIYGVTKKGHPGVKTISKKLVKGKAKIVVPKLSAGNHSLEIVFVETLSNGKKVTYTEYRTLEVVKQINIISGKKLRSGTSKVKVQAYKSGGKALAGKYIKIKMNKKLVKKVKTNKKGLATYKIPKTIKSGTYKITATYGKYSATKKVKISKATKR